MPPKRKGRKRAKKAAPKSQEVGVIIEQLVDSPVESDLHDRLESEAQTQSMLDQNESEPLAQSVHDQQETEALSQDLLVLKSMHEPVQEQLETDALSAQNLSKSQSKPVDDQPETEELSSQDLLKSQSKPVDDQPETEAPSAQNLLKSQSKPVQDQLETEELSSQDLLKSQSKPVQDQPETEELSSQDLLKSQSKPVQDQRETEELSSQDLLKSQSKPVQDQLETVALSSQDLLKSQSKPAQDQLETEELSSQDLLKSQSKPAQDQRELLSQPVPDQLQLEPQAELIEKQLVPHSQLIHDHPEPQSSSLQDQLVSPLYSVPLEETGVVHEDKDISLTASKVKAKRKGKGKKKAVKKIKTAIEDVKVVEDTESLFKAVNDQMDTKAESVTDMLQSRSEPVQDRQELLSDSAQGPLKPQAQSVPDQLQPNEDNLEPQSLSFNDLLKTESHVTHDQCESSSPSQSVTDQLVSSSLSVSREETEIMQKVVSLPASKAPAKQKGKSRKKAVKKVKLAIEDQACEGTEAEWAVSSCSDDSRKHVVLICRRRSDPDQHNEDQLLFDGNAVGNAAKEGSVISDLPITTSCNPPSIVAPQTGSAAGETCKDVMLSAVQMNIDVLDLNIEPESVTKVDAIPDVILPEPVAETSKPKRGGRNMRSKAMAVETTTSVEPRVTRSGRKSARLQAKQDEQVPILGDGDLEQNIVIPTEVVAAVCTDSAPRIVANKTQLTSVSGSPKKCSPTKTPQSASSLAEQIERASLVNVSVDIVLLSPKKLSDLSACDQHEGVASNLILTLPSAEKREQKPTSSLCILSDGQNPSTPIISNVTPTSIVEKKKKPRRCFSDTIQNSYAEQTGEEVSRLTQLENVNSNSKSKLVSDVSDLMQTCSFDGDRTKQAVAVAGPVSSVDSAVSNDGLNDTIYAGRTIMTELENVLATSVSSGGKVETGGGSRMLLDTEAEPHSDEEIPLKKRRIRTVLDAAAEQGEKSSEHGSDVSSEVLSERPLNIAVSDQRKVTIDNTLSVVRSLRRCNKYVGGHVSVTGSVSSALKASQAIGSQAIGMFIKRQGTLFPDPLSNSDALEFKQLLKTYGIAPHLIVPHASYLLNCGSGVPSDLENSRQSLVDDLKRCHFLGLPLFNFHPGSFRGTMTADECIDLIAASINYAHSQVKGVMTVLENMCGQSNTVGGKFLELRRIINRITDKSRVGVCLDTCHAFAAGYDLRTESGRSKMMDEFTQIIGLKYLKAIHANDSTDDVGSCKDHHAPIGQGKIGFDCFKWIMNEPMFDNLPIILETPSAGHRAEIELLYSFCR